MDDEGDQGARISADESRAIAQRFGRHISQGQVRYLEAGHLDVLETERQGIGFVDAATGRRMIDGFTSAGSFNLARHNPRVTAALEAALEEGLDLGSDQRLSPAKVALARALVQIAPGDLSRVVLAAGGGDAVDAALKLARGATGRREVISTVKAYHGHTGFALSANGKEHYRGYCEPLMPGFTFVPFNDLDAVRRAASSSTAAIIVEPVQGEAGIYVGTERFLRGLRRLCDELGVVLIFDEIQTGLGRTGRIFACEHSGVVPDIMTVAKTLGGGLMPSAALIYRDRPPLSSFVEEHPGFHRSVVGGSDLSCRVSLAVIEELVERRLWENAQRMGARLTAALEELRRRDPGVIKEVRGLGLMVGLEYIHEFMGPMMSDALARNGVFAAYSGNAPEVMRFMVPITIDDRGMDELINAIEAAVADMKRLLPLTLLVARVPPLLELLNDERVQTTLFGALRKVEDRLVRARWRRPHRLDGGRR